jgi:hypothetical protein
MSTFTRPLDRVLLKLREFWPGQVYRPHPFYVNRWVARCPVCQHPSVFTLTIIEFPLMVDGVEESGGEVRFDCWSGCDEHAVRQALGESSSEEDTAYVYDVLRAAA